MVICFYFFFLTKKTVETGQESRYTEHRPNSNLYPWVCASPTYSEEFPNYKIKNHQTQQQCTITHGCMRSMLNTDIIYNHLQSPSKRRPVPCDLTAGHCGILITAVIVFYVYGAGSDPTLCSCSYWTAWPPLSSDCSTLTHVCKPAWIQSESTFTSVWQRYDWFKWSDLSNSIIQCHNQSRWHYLKFNCPFFLVIFFNTGLQCKDAHFFSF